MAQDLKTKSKSAETAPAKAAAALQYQVGFNNQFATEARPGALPLGRNSPQKPPLGLYAEQISGTVLHRAARAKTAAPGPTASARRWCTGPTRASTTA